MNLKVKNLALFLLMFLLILITRSNSETPVSPLNGVVSFQEGSADSDTLKVDAGSSTIKATDTIKERGHADSRVVVNSSSGSGIVDVASVTNREGDSLYRVNGYYIGEGEGSSTWGADYHGGGPAIILDINGPGTADDYVLLGEAGGQLKVTVVGTTAGATVSFSVSGGIAEISNLVFTADGSQTIPLRGVSVSDFTISASASGISNGDTADGKVVGLDHLEYDAGDGWKQVPSVLEIKKDTSVQFKAVVSEPSAKISATSLAWSGEASGTGEQVSVQFNTASTSLTDYKTVKVSLGNTGQERSAKILVVEYLIGEDIDGDFQDKGPYLQVIDNAYWIARGKQNNFTARPEDSDADTLERVFDDTFEKAQAVHWSPKSSSGTFSPEYGVNTTWTVTDSQDKTEVDVICKVKDDGEYYQDTEEEISLASIKVHLFDYSGVSAIWAKDGATRKHSARLECVGTTNVTFEAEPEDPDLGFEPGYPKWKLGSTEIGTGASIQHQFTAPVSTYGKNEYIVSCIPKSGTDARPLLIKLIMYTTSKDSLEWDFGKIADDLNNKMAKFEALKKSGTVSWQKPNGTASLSIEYAELSHSNLVILAATGNIGLNPIIGISGEIQLFGPPAFITKYFSDNVSAGVFLTLSGSCSVNGEVGRRPNSEGTQAELYGGVTGTANVKGGLKAELKLDDYASVEAQGTTGVTVTVKAAADSTGIGWMSSGKWDGLDVTVKAKLAILGSNWEYSHVWPAVSGCSLWQGEGMNYLKTWN